MQFTSAMNDDFNTPLAISALFDLANEVNRWLDKDIATTEALEQVVNIFKELGGDVLGITPAEKQGGAGGNVEREAGLIELLIEMRLEARKAKNFAQADAIRDRLTKLGVTLEDGAKGTTFRVS